MSPSNHELDESFDRPTLEKGYLLKASGQVLEVVFDEPRGLLRGEVMGSARNPYVQTIQLPRKPLPGRQVFDHYTGFCSCPVGYNCKHVAAVLFEFLEEMRGTWSPTDADRSGAPASSADREDKAVKQWLDTLDSTLSTARAGGVMPRPGKDAGQKTPRKTGTPQRQKLIYLLSVDDQRLRVHVQPEVRAQLKDGGFSPTNRRNFDLSRYLQLNTPPAYLEEQDRLILGHLLAGRFVLHYDRGFHLEGAFALSLLQLVLRSGRAFIPADLRGQELLPVRWGEPVALRLQWFEVSPGRFRLATDSGTVKPVSLDPPLYHEPLQQRLGTLTLPIDKDVIRHLLAMPEIDGLRLPQVATHLQHTVGPLVPVPVQQEMRLIEAAPVPVLVLGKAEYRSLLHSGVRARLDRQRKAQIAAGEAVSVLSSTEQFCYVLPSFAYEDITIDPTHPEAEVSLWSAEGGVLVKRDLGQEAACLAELQAVGLRSLDAEEKSVAETRVEEALIFDLYHMDAPWFDLVCKQVPRWQERGWRITYTDDFPYENIVVPDASSIWYSNLQPGKEDNTLLLGIGIEVDGEQFNLLPCLLQLMQQYPPETLREMPDSLLLPVVVKDNRKLFLPVDRVRHLLGTLYDLFDSVAPGDVPRLRVSPHDLALLDALGMEQHYHASVEKLRRMVEHLRHPALAPAPTVPDSFLASLRDYQRDGVTWLQLLRESDSGGILADDMGLGKTVQTLAHLCIEQAAGRLKEPALLVAPTSVIGNWRAEAARFAPQLRVLVLHGTGRHVDFAAIAQHDLVVTTYPLVVRDAEHLLPLTFSVLILDEAQAIKNPQAQVSRVLSRITARQRLCLTGTPLENHLGELWSQFHFLHPGLLRDQATFNRLYRNPIEKTGDATRQRALHARIAPFLLRRTKAEVVTELPAKTEMIRRAEFKPPQRDLYETVRAALDKKVREAVARKGLTRSHIEILDALLKLRQICCDPALLKLPAAEKVKDSAKLELLQSLLPQLLEEGRRVLVFSQFTSMLARIEAWLRADGIDYLTLTGQTRDRQTPLERFQRGEVPLFLISLRAGGTGLNLTAADTVIHYDPWWNPAVEDQATDRAYRIGQDKPVFVYRLIVENTVEEKMLQMQDKKRALANTVYAQTGKLEYAFSEADLAELLG